MTRATATQIGALPRRLHLVGIGGSGMSAIARVLCLRGHIVTGSDLQANALTHELEALGAQVYIGHRAEQVGDAELVMISSAIPAHNAEVRAAHERGIPVLERRGFIQALLEGYRTIAVAGTHGKTTTAAMIAHILRCEGLAPSYIVGGVLADTGLNADAGEGDCFVIEADEYERMFLGLHPQVAVVTNIEMDHPDCFADLDDLRAAFEAFVAQVWPGGLVIACGDDAQVRRATASAAAEMLFYGEGAGVAAQVRAVASRGEAGLSFVIEMAGEVTPCRLDISGRHNALNATAAMLAARAVGVPLAHSAAHLGSYHGVQRRTELKGEAWGVVVVDDYAHHPTQIRATIAAMRQRYPERRLVTLFQPHTYSRTRVLFADYAASFAETDVALLLDVYRARAKEQVTVGAAELVRAMAHPNAHHTPTLDDAEAWLVAQVRPGDVVLTLGAGDGYLVGERLLQRLSERAL
jgi:UDP-N-acetylmuramate--alanine ligase